MSPNDQESINRAYTETVEAIFNVFYNAITLAQGMPDSEQAAQDRFQNGITHARRVRDLALAILSQPGLTER